MKMFIKKKQLSWSLIPFVLTACATGPYGEDYREYLERPVFADEINGKITVDDQTAYKKGQVNFRENPKLEIIDEVKRSKRGVNENDPKVELHFTYYKCEEKGLFPTQSEPLNVFLAVGTLGIWPIGSIKSCKTELAVRDMNSGKTLDSFAAGIDERSGGSFYQYLFGIRTKFMASGSWGLPARRLLLQYQEKLRTNIKP